MIQRLTRASSRPAEGSTIVSGSGARLRATLGAYLFILPTFLFLGYFLYYPAFTALRGAFTYWDGFSAPEWAGLDNFERAIFEDDVLRIAARNNLILALFEIVLSIVPSFLVAELIFHVQKPRLKYLYRALFVVPIVVPSLVNLLLWKYFYQGDGLLNVVLNPLGLANDRGWLSDPKTALYAVGLVGFPWINAFNMLIFFSALQNIPGEVLEAANLDGATGWRRIVSVDIPLVLAQFKLLFILAVINSFQGIVAPLVLTQGGPGYTTYVPAYHMYQEAVENGDFGYSMAISFLLFVFILALTIFNQRFIQDRT